MSQSVATVRVMPTHPSQGEWVIINEADFDPAAHRLYAPAESESVALTQQAEMPKRRGRPPKQSKEPT